MSSSSAARSSSTLGTSAESEIRQPAGDPTCWIVIQTSGAFPGDRGLRSWILFPHPSRPFAFIAHAFALLGNPIVATASVATACVLVDHHLGRRYTALVLVAVSAVALNTILKAILGPTPLQRSLYAGGPISARITTEQPKRICRVASAQADETNTAGGRGASCPASKPCRCP
jgi:hypothetical protein